MRRRGQTFLNPGPSLSKSRRVKRPTPAFRWAPAGTAQVAVRSAQACPITAIRLMGATNLSHPRRCAASTFRPSGVICITKPKIPCKLRRIFLRGFLGAHASCVLGVGHPGHAGSWKRALPGTEPPRSPRLRGEIFLVAAGLLCENTGGHDFSRAVTELC